MRPLRKDVKTVTVFFDFVHREVRTHQYFRYFPHYGSWDCILVIIYNALDESIWIGEKLHTGELEVTILIILKFTHVLLLWPVLEHMAHQLHDLDKTWAWLFY